MDLLLSRTMDPTDLGAFSRELDVVDDKSDGSLSAEPRARNGRTSSIAWPSA